MATFDCDDPTVGKLLQELESIVCAEGAELSEALIVRQRGPSLSVHSCIPDDRAQPLIRMPRHCLVPIEELEISCQGDEFGVVCSDSLSEAQVNMTHLMFEIFNRTEKLKYHRLTSPIFQFREETRISNLLHNTRPFFSELIKQLKQGKYEQVLVKTFLKSRTFNNRMPEEDGDMPVLMPFIDYLNHNSEATHFKFNQEDDGRIFLETANAKPVDDTDEVFVSYSPNSELMDTYTTFGFLDTLSEPYFVRSTPMTIEFPYFGELRVSSKISPPYKGELGERNRDLRWWLPTITHTGEEQITVSHLMIPSRHSPLALRRVLSFVLRALKEDAAHLRESVLAAEQQILTLNCSFYDSLLEAAQNPQAESTDESALKELCRLCELQLQQLQQYQEILSKRVSG